MGQCRDQHRSLPRLVLAYLRTIFHVATKRPAHKTASRVFYLRVCYAEPTQWRHFANCDGGPLLQRDKYS
jgi:hypothetical protein